MFLIDAPSNAGTSVVISNWVIDQPHKDQWVQIFRQTFQVN